jgi:hypothetical protein
MLKASSLLMTTILLPFGKPKLTKKILPKLKSKLAVFKEKLRKGGGWYYRTVPFLSNEKWSLCFCGDLIWI